MNRSPLATLASLLVAAMAFPLFGQPPQDPPWQANSLPLFTLLDLNQDGVLSQAEMKDATERLRKLDLDQDGYVDTEEILQSLSAIAQATSAPVTEPSVIDRPDPRRVRSSHAIKLSQRQWDIVERFMLSDLDKDQFLSWQEVPGQIRKQAFQADRNNDDRLTRNELIEFFHRMNLEQAPSGPTVGDPVAPRSGPVSGSSQSRRPYRGGGTIQAGTIDKLNMLILKGHQQDIDQLKSSLSEFDTDPNPTTNPKKKRAP